MVNPQNILGTISDLNFAASKITSLILTNTAEEPVYIDNFKFRGSIEGIGNTTANSAHIALVKRIEGAGIFTNVFDTVDGKDASLMLDRISKQVPLFVTGQINPTVTFGLSQKFMVKLRKDDTLVIVLQCNPGSCNVSGSWSYTRAQAVKRMVFRRRK